MGDRFDMEKLGFIGAGGMGGPMAANLLRAGFALTVFDLKREAVRALEVRGAIYASSPKAVAEASEVVLSMLPVNEAVLEVALGVNGLVAAVAGARIWIDLSSVEQGTIMVAESGLRSKGWTVIDASVQGVEEYAAAGELFIRVAGDKAAVERIRPILEPMGQGITYCGELGNAKLVKTATAMHAAVQTMAIVEVFNWLRSCGIGEEIARQVFEDSQAWSVAMQLNCERIVDGKFKARRSWMPKDIGFGLDDAREKGVPLPFTSLAGQMFDIGRSKGVDGYEAIGIACKVFDILGVGEKKTEGQG
jgi:2-hydroxy-3-oxopropionate reductase